MGHEERIEKALRSNRPLESLRGLVQALSTEGETKTGIVDAFEQQLIHLLENPARETDADAVRDILDFLIGWCSPHMKLLSASDEVSPTSPPR